MKLRHCELCNANAAVFCSSDAAFLCWSCDAKVHEANFLVARHVRQYVCSNCNNLTGKGVSGVGFQPFPATCLSCPPASAEDDDDDVGSVYTSSSTSSDCVSSTTSPAKEYSGGRSMATPGRRRRGADMPPRVDYFKAEGIFVDWCGKLGVGGGVDATVKMACKGLRVCGESWTILPFRVCLAASMWLGLRLSGEESVLTWKGLKRLEEISGVPAKIILAAEMKLERGLRVGRLQRRRRLELEEGWAEC